MAPGPPLHPGGVFTAQVPRAVNTPSGKSYGDIHRKFQGWLCPWLGAEGGPICPEAPHSLESRVWVGTVEDQVPQTQVRSGPARGDRAASARLKADSGTSSPVGQRQAREELTLEGWGWAPRVLQQSTSHTGSKASHPVPGMPRPHPGPHPGESWVPSSSPWLPQPLSSLLETPDPEYGASHLVALGPLMSTALLLRLCCQGKVNDWAAK